jgi:hypothetical protein
VYELALGDIVETAPDGDSLYVIQRVIVNSGHSTIRIWFGDSSRPDEAREALASAAVANGWLLEWSSSNLAALDAKSSAEFEMIKKWCAERASSGDLRFEFGKL